MVYPLNPLDEVYKLDSIFEIGFELVKLREGPRWGGGNVWKSGYCRRVGEARRIAVGWRATGG